MGILGRTYDIAPDEQRFLMIKEGAQAADSAAPAQLVLVEKLVRGTPGAGVNGTVTMASTVSPSHRDGTLEALAFRAVSPEQWTDGEVHALLHAIYDALKPQAVIRLHVAPCDDPDCYQSLSMRSLRLAYRRKLATVNRVLAHLRHAISWGMAPGRGRRVNRQALDQIDLRWHDIRHACASRWLEQGVDLRTIQQLLLGHTKVATTERYLNVTDEEIRRSMQEKVWRVGRAKVA